MKARSIAKGFLVVVGALFLGELALQAGSVAVWVLHRRSGTVLTSTEKVILCVGDSYTYGIGSSAASKSYPAQMETKLQSRGLSRWRVVNRSWPGSNSRELLENLPAQLRELEPSFVCVMVGINDQWSRPSPLTLAVDAPSSERSLRWRWRTWRLIQLVAQRFFTRRSGPAVPTSEDARSPSGPPSFRLLPGIRSAVRPSSAPEQIQGNWFADGFEIYFGEDRITTPRGTWKCAYAANELFVADPEGREVRLRWELRSGELRLLGSRYPAGMVLHRGSGLEQTVLKATQERHLSEVVSEIVGTRRGLTPANDTLRSMEILLRAAEGTGENLLALRLSRLLLEQGAAGAWIWRIYAWQSFLRGDVAAGASAIERAVALASTAWDRADIHWTRCWILRGTNPKEALKSAVSTLLLDREEKRFVQLVQAGGTGFNPAMLRECLPEIGVPAEQQGRIEALYAEAVENVKYLSIFEHHLKEIASVSNAHGARAVFLSYPFPSPDIEKVIMRAARETGSVWIDVRSEFDRLLTSHPRETFFVPDGHLNDEGYGTLADLIVARLQQDAALDRRNASSSRRKKGVSYAR